MSWPVFPLFSYQKYRSCRWPQPPLTGTQYEGYFLPEKGEGDYCSIYSQGRGCWGRPSESRYSMLKPDSKYLEHSVCFPTITLSQSFNFVKMGRESV